MARVRERARVLEWPDLLGRSGNVDVLTDFVVPTGYLSYRFLSQLLRDHRRSPLHFLRELDAVLNSASRHRFMAFYYLRRT